MAEGLVYLTRTSQGVNDDRNRVRSMLMNTELTDSNAVIIADAVTLLNAALGAEADAADVYPAGYFDTVVDISDLSGTGETNLRSDLDFIAWAEEVATVKTASV